MSTDLIIQVKLNNIIVLLLLTYHTSAKGTENPKTQIHIIEGERLPFDKKIFLDDHSVGEYTMYTIHVLY